MRSQNEDKTIMLRVNHTQLAFSCEGRLAKALINDYKGSHVSLIEKKSSGVKVPYFVSVTDDGELVDTYTGEPFKLSKFWQHDL
jgi:hypothetical protein